MRTPAGVDCRYYYEDYNRGRAVQECRLIQAGPRSLPWRPELCARCRVPAILRANGSPYLRLSLRVTRRLGLFTRLEVEAHCARHGVAVDDPFRGCAECAAETGPGAVART